MEFLTEYIMIFLCYPILWILVGVLASSAKVKKGTSFGLVIPKEEWENPDVALIIGRCRKMLLWCAVFFTILILPAFFISDAGAVLTKLNSMYGSPLSMDDLDELALEIGSDVPFFLRGGTCLVSGRGEHVKALHAFPECWFVICKPPVDFSAGQMYSLLDSRIIERRPDTNAFVSACEKGDLKEACCHIYNVFEPLAIELCRDVAVIKDFLLKNGAMAASLTGKGPSVFGVFNDPERCVVAAARLKEIYPCTFIAKSIV